MNLLLLIYLISIILLSCTHFSLTKGKGIWFIVFIQALLSVGFYKFSISQNNQTIDWILKQDSLVSGIAILLTFEAILIIFLTILQIKSYYKLKFPNLWKWVAILPPIQLIIAVVFLQTYLFLKVNGISLSFLAVVFFLSSSGILLLLTWAIKKLIKKWEDRAELQALIAMFQLLLAMFLPLMARGQKVGFTQITIDYYAIGFVVGLLLLISTFGYFIYKRKNNQIS